MEQVEVPDGLRLSGSSTLKTQLARNHPTPLYAGSHYIDRP
jgi:hypothetical protein